MGGGGGGGGWVLFEAFLLLDRLVLVEGLWGSRFWGLL